MSLISISFGNSKRRSEAETAAEDAEDELGKIDPREASDLALHAERCGRRFLLLRKSQRALNAKFDEKSDRNFTAMLIIGGILILKGIIPLSWAAKLVGL